MRVLAPLLVLALFGGIAYRWIADPGRDRSRSWIESSVDLATQRPDVKERLAQRLEQELDRHGDDPETRWFVARAWLKIGEVGRAIDAVFGDEQTAAAPGAARRFGALLLRVLGFADDRALARQRPGGDIAAIVLAAGGDEEAAAWLDETIRTRFSGGYLNLLFGTELYASRTGALRVAAALRARSQPASDVIAALIALSPESYPARDLDLRRTEEVVLRDSDRKQQRVVWGNACVALGGAEDDRALDLLAGLQRRLFASTTPSDRADGAVAAAGQLAGGRWATLEALAPHLGDRGQTSGVRPWYAMAAGTRLMRGDPEAANAWLAIWESLHSHTDPKLAEFVAADLLLGPTPPPAHFPVERVLTPLERADGSAASYAVAAAWRFRRGEPGARERLLGILRRLEAEGWAGQDLQFLDPIWISPVLTACSALYSFDASATP